jgi:hypothetical protein
MASVQRDKTSMVAIVRECAEYLNGTLMFSAISNTPSFRLHFLPSPGNAYPQKQLNYASAFFSDSKRHALRDTAPRFPVTG